MKSRAAVAIEAGKPLEITEVDDMVTHTMGLEDINTAFDLMHDGESIHSVVIY